MARPAELGVLRDRRPHRRHLAAALVDLAARGHLVVEDAGNDPEIGQALDWYLRRPRGWTGGAGEEGLRPHEQVLLELLDATPGLLLSAVRASGAGDTVPRTALGDVVARGWRRRGRPSWRTATGRAVLADVAAARAALMAERPAPDVTAALLPQAVTLGLGDLWAARLGQQRPPPPAWFRPGETSTARGWLGVTSFVTAVCASPPAGGGTVVSTGLGSIGG